MSVSRIKSSETPFSFSRFYLHEEMGGGGGGVGGWGWGGVGVGVDVAAYINSVQRHKCRKPNDELKATVNSVNVFNTRRLTVGTVCLEHYVQRARLAK